MSDHSLKVVHKVKKRYPIFQTEVLNPYPHSKGGQQLGVLEACAFLPIHKLLNLNLVALHGLNWKPSDSPPLQGDNDRFISDC